jgi:hypothetical protein
MAAIDENAKYTLANPVLGSSKVVASNLNSDQLEVETINPGQAQQWWYFKTTDVSQVYRIHSVQKGDDQALDLLWNFEGANTIRVHFYNRNDSSDSQRWLVDNWSDGSFRLSNYAQGPDVRISFNTSDASFFLAGGDHPEQHWSISRVGSLASVSSLSTFTTITSTHSASGSLTASPSASSTTSSTAPPSHHKGLSKGAIAGVVIGPLAALILLIFLIAFILKRRKERREERDRRARQRAALNNSPPQSQQTQPAMADVPHHTPPQAPARSTVESRINAYN